MRSHHLLMIVLLLLMCCNHVLFRLCPEVARHLGIVIKDFHEDSPEDVRWCVVGEESASMDVFLVLGIVLCLLLLLLWVIISVHTIIIRVCKLCRNLIGGNKCRRVQRLHSAQCVPRWRDVGIGNDGDGLLLGGETSSLVGVTIAITTTAVVDRKWARGNHLFRWRN